MPNFFEDGLKPTSPTQPKSHTSVESHGFVLVSSPTSPISPLPTDHPKEYKDFEIIYYDEIPSEEELKTLHTLASHSPLPYIQMARKSGALSAAYHLMKGILFCQPIEATSAGVKLFAILGRSYGYNIPEFTDIMVNICLFIYRNCIWMRRIQLMIQSYQKREYIPAAHLFAKNLITLGKLVSRNKAWHAIEFVQTSYDVLYRNPNQLFLFLLNKLGSVLKFFPAC